MPVTLIGRTLSPFTRRVAIALAHLEIPFVNDPIPTSDQERLRVFNPLGRIPALVLEDGEVLVDSLAIIDALAEMAGPEQELLPLSGARRRQVLKANAVMTGAIEKAVAAFYESARKAEGKQDPVWRAKQIEQANAGFAALEAAASEPWLCGFGPTIADVTVTTGFDFITAAMADDFDLSLYPALQRIAAEVRALPAYAAFAE